MKSLSGSPRYDKHAENCDEYKMCRACLTGHRTSCTRPWCPCICRDPVHGWRIRRPKPVVTVTLIPRRSDGQLVRRVIVADRMTGSKRLAPGASVQ